MRDIPRNVVKRWRLIGVSRKGRGKRRQESDSKS
jgi:hypothetical protein